MSGLANNNNCHELTSESSVSEKKSVKKKKSVSEETTTTTRVKKTKKTKKSEEKENISVKSSFGKFDQLTKKTVLHVRSSDPTKVQQQFNQNDASADGSLCKACSKTVFAMEQIKAERHVWHKNCFRCKTCNKQLTVDIYSSHEGELYCKPHFRDLFKPKVVIDDDEPSSDKPDLGLEELSSLDVKSRFQVFEKAKAEENNIEKSPVSVKRSASILSKLARFQAKGMDVGVPSDLFNGINYEESSSDDDQDETDSKIVIKEKPVAFHKMDDVRKSWENGQDAVKEERREERRQELQHIRSRLFMGKQGKMKEAYEQAVAESERGGAVKREVEIPAEKARCLKERFERGEVIHDDDSDKEEDAKNKSRVKEDEMDVFEAGISKQSRSLFQQLDASAKAKTMSAPPITPPPIAPSRSKESDSPDRDVPKNPDVVRSDEIIDDEVELKKSHTTSKMLSFFRQMEEAQDSVPDGPKPLKKFTPPPGCSASEESEEEESEEQSEASSIAVDDVVKASYKVEDEYLKQAQNAARAKALKEKFEHWEPEKHSANNAIELLDGEQASIDTTKSLRARFESLNADTPAEKPRPKVNRFV